MTDELPLSSFNIRSVDVRKDLAQVADLIEEGFALHGDVDAQEFLQSLRRTARDMNMMKWVNLLPQFEPNSTKGFVWEEDQQIIGNISIIPFLSNKKYYYLIANVAVRQPYRRRGIGKALTIRALQYLKGIKAEEIWLQVSSSNQAAINLYQSLGFKCELRRNIWECPPLYSNTRNESPPQESQVRNRKFHEWSQQKLWLSEIYPDIMRWHLQVSFKDFKPLDWWDPTHWFEVLNLRHRVVIKNGTLFGFVTRQLTDSFSDNIWLAFDQQKHGDEKIKLLLDAVPDVFLRKKPIRVDVPSGLGETTFGRNGFFIYRSLDWMKYYPPSV